MRIIYTKGFISDMDDLAGALYRRKYFAYHENVESYIEFIYKTIREHLAVKRKRRTPKKIIRHGEFYVTVIPNRQTTWYIFFDVKEDVYRINAIFNNHLPTAGLLKGK